MMDPRDPQAWEKACEAIRQAFRWINDLPAQEDEDQELLAEAQIHLNEALLALRSWHSA